MLVSGRCCKHFNVCTNWAWLKKAQINSSNRNILQSGKTTLCKQENAEIKTAKSFCHETNHLGANSSSLVPTWKLFALRLKQFSSIHVFPITTCTVVRFSALAITPTGHQEKPGGELVCPGIVGGNQSTLREPTQTREEARTSSLWGDSSCQDCAVSLPPPGLAYPQRT